MRSVLIISLACLSAISAWAQPNNSFTMPSYNSLLNNNFLDMSRLSIKQSFSMSYLSTGRGSMFSNLYRNSMSYKLSDKLELNLDLAYRFTPNQFNSLTTLQNGTANQGVFLPSFGMRYQPSKSFLIEFQYNQSDLLPYGNYPWGRRY